MGNLIAVGLLIIGIIAMVGHARRARGCFRCHSPLARVRKLPRPEYHAVHSLLRGHLGDMGGKEVNRLLLCRSCGRVFGKGWQRPRTLWDSYPGDERSLCSCSVGIANYPFRTAQSKGVEAIKAQIVDSLQKRGLDSSCLHCEQSLLQTDDTYPAPESCYECSSEDKVLICASCGRVFRWEPIRGSSYRMFECIYQIEQEKEPRGARPLQP